MQGDGFRKIHLNKSRKILYFREGSEGTFSRVEIQESSPGVFKIGCKDAVELSLNIDMTEKSAVLYMLGNHMFKMSAQFKPIAGAPSDNLIELKGNGNRNIYLNRSRKILLFREGNKGIFADVAIEGDTPRAPQTTTPPKTAIEQKEPPKAVLTPPKKEEAKEVPSRVVLTPSEKYITQVKDIIPESLKSGGWTHVLVPYDNGKYIYLVRGNDGYSQFYRMDEKARIGSMVSQHHWNNKWTLATFFHVGGSGIHLFLYNGETGKMLIHDVKPEGEIGRLVDEKKLDSGYTAASFYRIGTRVYLFFLKESDGKVRIYQMNTNTSLGYLVDEHDWSRGWTTAKFWSKDFDVFLFLHKTKEGTVNIHKMNADGTVGDKIEEHNWTGGWDMVEIFETGRLSRIYLYLQKSQTHETNRHKLETDGTIGVKLMDKRSIDIWSQATLFRISITPYILLFQRNTGLLEIREFESDGSFGKVVFSSK